MSFINIKVLQLLLNFTEVPKSYWINVFTNLKKNRTNNYRKILFLDFDGVMNTEFYPKVLNQQCENWQDEYGALFDPNAVKQLKRIIDATDADDCCQRVNSW